MGVYDLLAIIAACAALVAAAYFVTRSIRHAREVVTRPIDSATGMVEAAIDRTVEAGRSLAQPISDAVGSVGEALAERMKRRHADLNRLQGEVAELTARIAELECRRINIDQAKAVLQVAFVEASLSYTDFDLSTASERESSAFTRSEREEYLGVVRAEYRQRLGVDFEELRFQQIGPDEIAVSGLGRTELIGVLDVNIRPLLIELRRHIKGGQVRGSESTIVVGDPDNTRTCKADEQRERVLRVVNERPDSREIDQAIERMALSFLTACFAPSRYRIVTRDRLTEPRSFYDICRQVNNEIDKQISDSQGSINNLIERTQAIECEAVDESIDAVRRVQNHIALRLGRTHGE